MKNIIIQGGILTQELNIKVTKNNDTKPKSVILKS